MKKTLEPVVRVCKNIKDINLSPSPCHPMLQRSKIIRSRDGWKQKAVRRAEEIRENRKKQRRYRQKIAQLQAQIRALEQTAEEKKTHRHPPRAGIWLTWPKHGKYAPYVCYWFCKRSFPFVASPASLICFGSKRCFA
jgi:hypothetical protein